MLLGTAIHRKPKREPCEPERAGENQRPWPSEPQRDQRHDQRSYDGADVGARVEQPGRKRALPFRTPLGHGLDGRWKVAGLTESKRDSRYAKPKCRTRH